MLSIPNHPQAVAAEDDTHELFASLPRDVAARVLTCAGGPAALQETRATCRCWRSILDSLVTTASRSSLTGTDSSSCLVLQLLPRLHTVDLSSCCEPLPPGRLGDTLQQLSQLPQLSSLKLSMWCLALLAHVPLQQQQRDRAAAVRTYGVVLPQEIGLMTGLQELVIGPCADVSQPRATMMHMSPAVMRLPQLTRLELHGFLPPVHHLRGLQHLQHLSLGVSCDRGTDAAPGTPGDSVLQHKHAVAEAAKAAVCSLSSLTSLQLCLGPTVADDTHRIIKPVAELLELLTLYAPGPAAAAPSETLAPACTPGGGSSSRDRSCAAAAATDTPAPTDEQAAAAAVLTGALEVAAAAVRAPLCRLQQLSLVNAGALYHLSARLNRGCLAGLRELDVSNCSIAPDAAAVLGSLTCLTSLQAAQAGLHVLPDTWTRLTALQVLNVAANPLCVLPHWVSRLQHLHTLLLSSTHLQELPSCISSLVRLRHLDLASNKLQELPQQLCACTGLVHLDVSKNRLLALPEALTALSCITQLSLTGNHLESVPAGLQHLQHLAHLGLALNYYKAWAHAAHGFASLSHTLQELELQHTVTVLDDAAGFLAAIGQLTALTSLAAGSNQLNDLPQEWQQLKRLKVLQLSHNAMETLPISLLSLSALTYLDVSYNRLTALPFWVGSSKLQQLRRLNLAKNHLTTLPVEMSSLLNLTQLQVQGNNLASLPSCLGALRSLRVLNLGCNYKLKEGGLAQEVAGLPRLRDVVLPYRFEGTAEELRSIGKAVLLD